MTTFFSAPRKWFSDSTQKLPQGRGLWHFQQIKFFADEERFKSSEDWKFHVETGALWSITMEVHL